MRKGLTVFENNYNKEKDRLEENMPDITKVSDVMKGMFDVQNL